MSVQRDEEGIRINIDYSALRQETVNTSMKWDQYVNWANESIGNIFDEINIPGMQNMSDMLQTPGKKSRKKRLTTAQIALLSAMKSVRLGSNLFNGCDEQSKRNRLTLALSSIDVEVNNPGKEEETGEENKADNENEVSLQWQPIVQLKKVQLSSESNQIQDDVVIQQALTLNPNLSDLDISVLELETDGLKIESNLVKQTPADYKKNEASTSSTSSYESAEPQSSGVRKGKTRKISRKRLTMRKSTKRLRKSSVSTAAEVPALTNTVNDSLMSEDLSPEKVEQVKETANRKEIDKNGENKNTESDEWMTDDEMETKKQSHDGTFYDAVDEMKKDDVQTESKQIVSRPRVAKRPPSEYFTPQSSNMKTVRTITRAQSRLINTTTQGSKMGTPQQSRTLRTNMNTRQDTSGASETGRQTAGSATRSRCMYRVKQPGSETKKLTDSAAKKRREAEEQRLIQLEKNIEKEKKAGEMKKLILEEKVAQQKLRREEKEKRVAELRLKKEIETEEKRAKELKKGEEIEKRIKLNECIKKEESKKRAEVLLTKKGLADQRKEKEEQERLEKIQKLEELNKKQQEEAEKRRQEQDKINALIQQHNSSLQQKAIANSFLSKASENNKADNEENTTEQRNPEAESVKPSAANATFTQSNSYAMTPLQPINYKIPNPDNYDINDIHSDDDTDDERRPKKPIPNWAKGKEFIAALGAQYAKPMKLQERERAAIFPTVILPVELGTIFEGHTAVIPKYAKRTSSAVWVSPPVKHDKLDMSFNTSSSNYSSSSETSLRK